MKKSKLFKRIRKKRFPIIDNNLYPRYNLNGKLNPKNKKIFFKYRNYYSELIKCGIYHCLTIIKIKDSKENFYLPCINSIKKLLKKYNIVLSYRQGDKEEAIGKFICRNFKHYILERNGFRHYLIDRLGGKKWEAQLIKSQERTRQIRQLKKCKSNRKK